MKKLFAILLLAVLAFSLFAQAATETAQSNEPVTIEFWTHEDANRQALEEQYIAEFEATHPNVKINRSVYSSTKIPEIVMTAYASGSGPDIFNLQISHEYSYIINGLVAPVDYQAAGFKDAKAMAEHYMPGILDPVTVDGKIYGMPLEITNWVVYVDKNVFVDAGLDPVVPLPQS